MKSIAWLPLALSATILPVHGAHAKDRISTFNVWGVHLGMAFDLAASRLSELVAADYGPIRETAVFAGTNCSSEAVGAAALAREFAPGACFGTIIFRATGAEAQLQFVEEPSTHQVVVTVLILTIEEPPQLMGTVYEAYRAQLQERFGPWAYAHPWCAEWHDGPAGEAAPLGSPYLQVCGPGGVHLELRNMGLAFAAQAAFEALQLVPPRLR